MPLFDRCVHAVVPHRNQLTRDPQRSWAGRKQAQLLLLPMSLYMAGRGLSGEVAIAISSWRGQSVFMALGWMAEALTSGRISNFVWRVVEPWVYPHYRWISCCCKKESGSQVEAVPEGECLAENPERGR